jgi:hypothetical protein
MLDSNINSVKKIEDEEKKLKVKKEFEKKVIEITSIITLDDAKKYSIIKEILEDIYEEDNKILNKNIFNVMSLLDSKEDKKEITLPGKLKVKKDKEKIIFYVNKNNTLIFWLLIIWSILLFATALATYSYLKTTVNSDLNKDIDGDGIPDINLDLNNDNVADINVDTDQDDKPNINIDYKGNRRSVFNIDADGDGVADYNLVTYVKGDFKLCTINCDIDDDGWPDVNIDIDGDGVADLDIDTDKDGTPDLNLDVNGDGICDVRCDDNGDKICDRYCISDNTDGKESGSSTDSGEPSTDYEITYLQINFLQGNSVNIRNIFPDDQTNYLDYGNNNEVPDKVVKVENTSSYAMMYNFEFVLESNTFVSNNFKYKITSTNGGGSLDWQTAPFQSTVIFERVIIPARTTQTYNISFKLQGINASQNYDQGKEFIGYFKINSI